MSPILGGGRGSLALIQSTVGTESCGVLVLSPHPRAKNRESQCRALRVGFPGSCLRSQVNPLP